MASIQEKCAICLDTLAEDFTTLPCDHRFCNLCIAPWMFHNSCPICLEAIQHQEGGMDQGPVEDDPPNSDNEVEVDEEEEDWPVMYDGYEEEDDDYDDGTEEGHNFLYD